MPGFDPEFQPGAVRAELEEIDQQIRLVESNVLEGRCKSYDDLQRFLGIRTGLTMARTIKTKRLDDETKRRLGIAP